MDDGAVIDPQALDRLKEWGGEKLMTQMVRLFLDNSSTRMDQIRAGVRERDVAEAEKGSHSLKSSAANVGVLEVRRLAADIEAASVSGDIDAVEALLPEIEDAYAKARVALGSLVEGNEE